MTAKLFVAIVGSRNFAFPALVVQLVTNLTTKVGPENLVIVSGGARGPDSIAEATARSLGVEVLSFPADWDGPLGKGAGHARNTDIVNASSILIAFWDLKSTGTMDSVWKAHKAGKKVTVLDEHGKVVDKANWLKPK